LTNDIRFELINCYNEGCEELWKPSFYLPIKEEVDALILMNPDLKFANAADSMETSIPKFRGDVRLPFGCRLLSDLPQDHPAIQFIYKQYPGISVNPSIIDFLAEAYGVCFTSYHDDLYPSARDRIIFPIRDEHKIVGWQGRRIDGLSKMRWFFPPGCGKVIYNGYRIPPTEIPIFSEGIVNAIACGLNGAGLFGKSISGSLLDYVCDKWSTVILATDPETFIPDNRRGERGRVYANELRKSLQDRGVTVRMLPWPSDVMELAKRHNNGEDVKVPDAADLGFSRMRELIRKVI
jgi:hypothetical protein